MHEFSKIQKRIGCIHGYQQPAESSQIITACFGGDIRSFQGLDQSQTQSDQDEAQWGWGREDYPSAACCKLPIAFRHLVLATVKDRTLDSTDHGSEPV